MKLIDANLIIRYLTRDDPKKAHKVKKLLEDTNEELLLTDLTLAEIVWTLSSFYKFNKEEIIEKLQPLLIMENINCNRELLLRTLFFYKNYKLSFIDAYLSAYSMEEDLEGIYSYDRDFDKVKTVKRSEP